MADLIELTLDETEAGARAALSRLALAERERERILDELLFAELSGKRSHGLVRVPWLINWMSDKRHAAPRPTHESPMISHFDCTGSIGYLAAGDLATTAGEMAKRSGFHLCVAHSIFPTGVLSYYLRDVVAGGLLAAALGRTPWLVKPRAASRRFLGTNPVAFGFPDGGDEPFLCDLTTAATSFGQLLLARAGIEPFEPEKFVTADGATPATPDDLFGPKGLFEGAIVQELEGKNDARQVALLMAVEVLTGFFAGTESKGGLVFMALDPAQFPTFDAAAARKVIGVASEAMAPETLPGAHGAAFRARALARGRISVVGSLWDEIVALGKAAPRCP